MKFMQILLTCLASFQLFNISDVYFANDSLQLGTCDNVSLDGSEYQVSHFDPQTYEAMFAIPFNIEVSEVSSITADEIIKRSKIHAFSIKSFHEKVEITTVDFSSLKSEIGVYKVNLSTSKGSQVTIPVVVSYDNGNITINNEEAVISKNFVTFLDETSQLSFNRVLELTSAKAYNLVTYEQIEIYGINYSSVLRKVGAYEIGISTRKGTCVQSVANIGSGRTVINEEFQEAIDAQTFLVLVDEVDELDKKKMIDKAFAKAWSMVDKKENLDIFVDMSNLKKESGIYNIIYSTKKGTSVEVPVIVKQPFDKVVIDYEKDEAILLCNFTITPKEVSTLTEDDVARLSLAQAVDIKNNKEVPFTEIDISKIKSEVGSYPISFKTTNNSLVNVYAIVGYNGNIEGNLAISSKNITLDITDIDTANIQDFHEQILTLSETKIIDVTSNELVEYDNDNFEMMILENYTRKNEIGYQNLRTNEMFKMDNIEYNVKMNQGVLPVEFEITKAKDFSILDSEVKSLTEEDIIELAGAKAWNNFTEVGLKVDHNNLKTEEGVYSIYFKTDKGTYSLVDAYVGDGRRPIIKEGIVFFGDNYILDEDVVFKDLTMEDHVENMNLRAFNQYTHELLTIDYIDTSKVMDENGTYPIILGVEDVRVTFEVTLTNIGEGYDVTHNSFISYLLVIFIFLVMFLLYRIFKKKYLS